MPGKKLGMVVAMFAPAYPRELNLSIRRTTSIIVLRPPLDPNPYFSIPPSPLSGRGNIYNVKVSSYRLSAREYRVHKVRVDVCRTIESLTIFIML
jgi:hypothetical protein